MDHGLPVHTRIGTGFPQFEAQSGIDHIFPIAEIPGHTEHGPIIRAIESPQSHGTGIPIVAEAYGEIPFVIGIEILGMECRQSCRPGPHFVQTAVQLGNPAICLVDVLGIFFHPVCHALQLSIVHSVRIFRPSCHVGDLFTAGIHPIFCHRRTAGNGHPIRGKFRAPSGYAVYGKILFQIHRKGIPFHFG